MKREQLAVIREQGAGSSYQRAGGRERRAVSKVVGVFLCSLLIVLCSLLVACQEHPSAAPVSETGSFTLQLGDSAARTIMPNTPQMSEFAVFELDFVPDTTNPNGAERRTVYPDNPNFGAGTVTTVALDPVILVAGNYVLTVRAYKTAGTPPTGLAAQSAATSITINPGADVARSVTLNALLDDGTGTFSWNVTVAVPGTTISAATMTIVNGSNVTQGDVVTLTTAGAANTGTRDLPAGIYTVNFSLMGHEMGDIYKEREIVWSELLYVYSTLTSRFPATADTTFTFNDAHFFRTHWKVVLIYDNADKLNELDPASVATQTQSVMHGNALGAIPTTERKGFLFGGWFHNSDGTGDAWTLTDPVHKDLELYAKWTPNTATIELDIADIDNPPLTITPATIEISTASNATPDGTPFSEVTVRVTAVAGATNYKWEIKSVNIDKYPNISEAGTTMTEFKLEASNDSYNTVGGHVLKLTVTVGTAPNERQYVKNIPFNVVN